MCGRIGNGNPGDPEGYGKESNGKHKTIRSHKDYKQEIVQRYLVCHSPLKYNFLSLSVYDTSIDLFSGIAK